MQRILQKNNIRKLIQKYHIDKTERHPPESNCQDNVDDQLNVIVSSETSESNPGFLGIVR